MNNRVMSALFLACAVLILATGCGPEEFSDGEITSLSLSRSTFTVSETGMTDEFINAEVTFTGFFDPVDADASEIFLQEFNRAAVPRSSEVQGNTLFLNEIATSWLSGLGVGTHNVGATLVTSTGSVTQLDLTTVTITE
jgi:hypothetical protein